MDQQVSAQKIDVSYETDPKCMTFLKSHRLLKYEKCYIQKFLYGSTKGMLLYDRNIIEKILRYSTKKNIEVLLEYLNGQKRDAPLSATKQLSELIKNYISKQQNEVSCYYLVINIEVDDFVDEAYLVYLHYSKHWVCVIIPIIYRPVFNSDFNFLCTELENVEVRVGRYEWHRDDIHSTSIFRVEIVIEYIRLRLKYIKKGERFNFEFKAILDAAPNAFSGKYKHILKQIDLDTKTTMKELKCNKSKKVKRKLKLLSDDRLTDYKTNNRIESKTNNMIDYKTSTIKKILSESTKMNVEVISSYSPEYHLYCIPSTCDLIKEIKLYLAEHKTDAIWYVVLSLNEEGLVNYAFLAQLYYPDIKNFCCRCHILPLIDMLKVDKQSKILDSELEYEEIIVCNFDTYDLGITSFRVEQLIEYAKLRMKYKVIHTKNLHSFLSMYKEIMMAERGTFTTGHQCFLKQFIPDSQTDMVKEHKCYECKKINLIHTLSM